MMLIILTHDSQSKLSWFSLFLSFVTNSPVAEKSLSGSTDLELIVIKAWNSFSRLFDRLFVASKRLISFFTICDRISSCAGIVFCGLHFHGLHGFCAVISNGWLNVWCLNHLPWYNGAQIALWCWLSLVLWEMTLNFWFSLITNVFKLNVYD